MAEYDFQKDENEMLQISRKNVEALKQYIAEMLLSPAKGVFDLLNGLKPAEDKEDVSKD